MLMACAMETEHFFVKNVLLLKSLSNTSVLCIAKMHTAVQQYETHQNVTRVLIKRVAIFKWNSTQP
jgi:hypothetical protein